MASKIIVCADDAPDARRARERLAPEDRRAQIVAAALDLLVESHALEPSFSILAERLGISRNLIYHYFSCPATLLNAVVENECQAVIAEVGVAVHGTTSLPKRERLETVLLAYIRAISARMQFVRLVTSSSEAAKFFNNYVAQNAPIIFDVILALVPHKAVREKENAACIEIAMRAWIEFLRYFMHSLVLRAAAFDEKAIARFAADVITTVVGGAAALDFSQPPVGVPARADPTDNAPAQPLLLQAAAAQHQ